MTPHLALGLKWSAFILLSLSVAMAVLRMLWVDISWGFLLFFGLQVVLILATLQLILTTIWKPSSRWALPNSHSHSGLPRRIFAQKTTVMAFLRGMDPRLVHALKNKTQRLFKRKTL
jgi:hypothetical protein